MLFDPEAPDFKGRLDFRLGARTFVKYRCPLCGKMPMNEVQQPRQGRYGPRGHNFGILWRQVLYSLRSYRKRNFQATGKRAEEFTLPDVAVDAGYG